MRILVALAIAFLAGCSNDVTGVEENELKESATSDRCIKVSYVGGICGQALLKIEDPRFANLGGTWNELKDVFQTMLPCDAPGDISARSFFFVRLIDRENVGECPRCLAIIEYPGVKAYHIELVETCGR